MNSLTGIIDIDNIIYNIINREALEGNWEVHTIDFAIGRALLVREISTKENIGCSCQKDEA